MGDLYSELKKKTGQKCFTLTQNKPAIMEVDEWKITIIYPSGRTTQLPRPMVTEAIRRLQVKGMLTLEEVHEELTHRHGPQTDRLLAVLRELPGVHSQPPLARAPDQGDQLLGLARRRAAPEGQGGQPGLRAQHRQSPAARQRAAPGAPGFRPPADGG